MGRTEQTETHSPHPPRGWPASLVRPGRHLCQAGRLRDTAGSLCRPEVAQQERGAPPGLGRMGFSVCACLLWFRAKKKMISHIIRAVAARLCARCFYWKYQEEGQGRAVFLSPPRGLEGGGGAQRLQGLGQQAVFRPGAQLSGSPAQLCRLRLAVEVGSVWGVHWGRGVGERERWGLLPTPSSPSPCLQASSEKEELGGAGKG